MIFLPITEADLQIVPPLMNNVPFAFMWNAPTELCLKKYDIDLDLNYFHYVSSTLKTSTNQPVSIFYIDRFGSFPFIDRLTGKFYNGGLPQLGNLKDHHKKAAEDITFYIPSENAGLAVIDMEDWSPQWIRNWGIKNIYRNLSVSFAFQVDLTLTSDSAAQEIARKHFETAAKNYMKTSLMLGKSLRANRLWGYYLYPECYNYDYNQNPDNYSGKCPDIELKRNNDLQWLWQESSALFPSIYLEKILKNSYSATLFVRNRVLEAMRISLFPNRTNYSLPVYVYTRLVYTDSISTYLTEADLVSTIGESAALGAAGIVEWGDLNLTLSKDICSSLRTYIQVVLNPYVLNVTTASRLCSESLCGGEGRCVRRNMDSNTYLHLNSRNFQITRMVNGTLKVTGQLTKEDIQWEKAFLSRIIFTKAAFCSAENFALLPSA
ncbi:hyaluronidase PH-20-like [Polypterus senegalus]|uniref:hyaluronidase PH-20-like n=1 Tax=Polypterus senegalus TaxID=55291 RepID=UPI00196667B2|nr:hyaluronidase PH-20-like [Polypterus senegalus]